MLGETSKLTMDDSIVKSKKNLIDESANTRIQNEASALETKYRTELESKNEEIRNLKADSANAKSFQNESSKKNHKYPEGIVLEYSRTGAAFPNLETQLKQYCDDLREEKKHTSILQKEITELKRLISNEEFLNKKLKTWIGDKDKQINQYEEELRKQTIIANKLEEMKTTELERLTQLRFEDQEEIKELWKKVHCLKAELSDKRFTERDVKLVSTITAFLLIHPFGVDFDCIIEYVKRMDVTAEVVEVQSVLERCSSVFISEDKKWMLKPRSNQDQKTNWLNSKTANHSAEPPSQMQQDKSSVAPLHPLPQIQSPTGGTSSISGVPPPIYQAPVLLGKEPVSPQIQSSCDPNSPCGISSPGYEMELRDNGLSSFAEELRLVNILRKFPDNTQWSPQLKRRCQEIAVFRNEFVFYLRASQRNTVKVVVPTVAPDEFVTLRNAITIPDKYPEEVYLENLMADQLDTTNSSSLTTNSSNSPQRTLQPVNSIEEEYRFARIGQHFPNYWSWSAPLKKRMRYFSPKKYLNAKAYLSLRLPDGNGVNLFLPKIHQKKMAALESVEIPEKYPEEYILDEREGELFGRGWFEDRRGVPSHPYSPVHKNVPETFVGHSESYSVPRVASMETTPLHMESVHLPGDETTKESSRPTTFSPSLTEETPAVPSISPEQDNKTEEAKRNEEEQVLQPQIPYRKPPVLHINEEEFVRSAKKRRILVSPQETPNKIRKTILKKPSSPLKVSKGLWTSQKSSEHTQKPPKRKRNADPVTNEKAGSDTVFGNQTTSERIWQVQKSSNKFQEVLKVDDSIVVSETTGRRTLVETSAKKSVNETAEKASTEASAKKDLDGAVSKIDSEETSAKRLLNVTSAKKDVPETFSKRALKDIIAQGNIDGTFKSGEKETSSKNDLEEYYAHRASEENPSKKDVEVTSSRKIAVVQAAANQTSVANKVLEETTTAAKKPSKEASTKKDVDGTDLEENPSKKDVDVTSRKIAVAQAAANQTSAAKKVLEETTTDAKKPSKEASAKKGVGGADSKTGSEETSAKRLLYEISSKRALKDTSAKRNIDETSSKTGEKEASSKNDLEVNYAKTALEDVDATSSKQTTAAQAATNHISAKKVLEETTSTVKKTSKEASTKKDVDGTVSKTGSEEISGKRLLKVTSSKRAFKDPPVRRNIDETSSKSGEKETSSNNYLEENPLKKDDDATSSKITAAARQSSAKKFLGETTSKIGEEDMFSKKAVDETSAKGATAQMSAKVTRESRRSIEEVFSCGKSVSKPGSVDKGSRGVYDKRLVKNPLNLAKEKMHSTNSSSSSKEFSSNKNRKSFSTATKQNQSHQDVAKIEGKTKTDSSLKNSSVSIKTSQLVENPASRSKKKKKSDVEKDERKDSVSKKREEKCTKPPKEINNDTLVVNPYRSSSQKETANNAEDVPNIHTDSAKAESCATERAKKNVDKSILDEVAINKQSTKDLRSISSLLAHIKEKSEGKLLERTTSGDKTGSGKSEKEKENFGGNGLDERSQKSEANIVNSLTDPAKKTDRHLDQNKGLVDPPKLTESEPSTGIMKENVGDTDANIRKRQKRDKSPMEVSELFRKLFSNSDEIVNSKRDDSNRDVNKLDESSGRAAEEDTKKKNSQDEKKSETMAVKKDLQSSSSTSKDAKQNKHKRVAVKQNESKIMTFEEFLGNFESASEKTTKESKNKDADDVGQASKKTRTCELEKSSTSKTVNSASKAADSIKRKMKQNPSESAKSSKLRVLSPEKINALQKPVICPKAKKNAPVCLKKSSKTQLSEKEDTSCAEDNSLKGDFETLKENVLMETFDNLQQSIEVYDLTTDENWEEMEESANSVGDENKSSGLESSMENTKKKNEIEESKCGTSQDTNCDVIKTNTEEVESQEEPSETPVEGDFQESLGFRAFSTDAQQLCNQLHELFADSPDEDFFADKQERSKRIEENSTSDGSDGEQYCDTYLSSADILKMVEQG
nr:uncharacterized protein LOC111509044 [Leptinotarsa decemlineata]